MLTLDSDPQEQRYQVMLRSSSAGSKVPEESPGNQHVVSRKSRSRPRHPAGLEPNSDIGDRGTLKTEDHLG